MSLLERWRTPRRTLLAALVVAAVAACSSPAPAPVPTPVPNASSCVPFSRPTTVEELDSVVTAYRSVPSFRGGDVGADVLLSDGRGLWVFGDTLRGTDFPGPRYVRNSMLLFSSSCITVVSSTGNGAVIPDRADGVGYWPMSIGKVSRDGYDLVAVMAQRVRGSGDEGHFENLGPAIAVFRVDRGGQPVLQRVTDLGPDSTDRRRPTWGAAVWVADDGYAYIYGTSNPEQRLVFGCALSVARTKPEDVEHPETWDYWDGRTWQHDAARAEAVIAAQGGVSQTLSVFERDGRWWVVSKRDEFLGHDLVVWSSRSPTGPFSASDPVAQIPSDLTHHLVRYMPLAHPDLLPTPGHVIVSVSQNSDDPALLAADPVLYRPRFFQIALPGA